MNNLFQNGPKQVSNFTNMTTQNNSFKQAIEDSVFINTKLNDQMNTPYQKSFSYEQYKNEVGNRVDNEKGMNMSEMWNVINANNVNNFNNDVMYLNDGRLNINNSTMNMNINNEYNQTSNFQRMGYMNTYNSFAPKEIHPSLNYFNEVLKKEQDQIKSEEKVKTDTTDNKEDENNEEMNDVYTQIINVMESQGDERQKNSDFLKFMKKLKKGEMKLNENENKVDYTNMINENKDHNMLFDNLYHNLNDKFIFNNDYPQSQSEQIPIINENIDYDRVEKARELLKIPDTKEAKRILEEEVYLHKENFEAWILLGQIHSDMDDDDLAYNCFKKSLQYDRFNSDCYFQLGIACTNRIESYDAMVNLLEYMKNHPLYSKVVENNKSDSLNYALIDEEVSKIKLNEDSNWEYVNVIKKDFNKEVMRLFNIIYESSIKKDCNFYMAKGISEFILNLNENAIFSFRKAVEIDPNNYNSWNKLGAIYAHSQMSDLALECYNKALSIKTDYVRCYSNLSLALSSLGRKKEAVVSSLKAIKYAPNNYSLVFYVKSLFAELNQKEDFDLCDRYEIKTLLNKYGII